MNPKKVSIILTKQSIYPLQMSLFWPLQFSNFLDPSNHRIPRSFCGRIAHRIRIQRGKGMNSAPNSCWSDGRLHKQVGFLVIIRHLWSVSLFNFLTTTNYGDPIYLGENIDNQMLPNTHLSWSLVLSPVKGHTYVQNHQMSIQSSTKSRSNVGDPMAIHSITRTTGMMEDLPPTNSRKAVMALFHCLVSSAVIILHFSIHSDTPSNAPEGGGWPAYRVCED